MLTNVGLTMLSEAQVSSEPLTLTRVEIGSQFTQANLLPTLTSVLVPKGTPLIGETTAGVDGSKITIVSSNVGVITPYSICQVGVYATHPKVNSGAESLYLISQCESPADTVPVYDSTPLKIIFNMYIKHDRAQNVTVVIDEAYMPKATADTLGAIKVGANLTIDDNGVLSGVNSFTLPTASNSVLGGVKVGSGLTIDASGVLNALGTITYREVV